MGFIYYDRFTIITPLSKKEVLYAIKQVEDLVMWGDYEIPARVQPDDPKLQKQFKLHRIYSVWLRTLSPVIIGDFYDATSKETCIDMLVRFSYFDLLKHVLIIAVVVVACIVMLSMQVHLSVIFLLALIPQLLFPIVPIVRKKRELLEVLCAEIVVEEVV